MANMGRTTMLYYVWLKEISKSIYIIRKEMKKRHIAGRAPTLK